MLASSHAGIWIVAYWHKTAAPSGIPRLADGYDERMGTCVYAWEYACTHENMRARRLDLLGPGLVRVGRVGRTCAGEHSTQSWHGEA